MPFFRELKRRHVIRVGLIYIASAWGVLEVGDLLFPILNVPDWSMRLLLGLLLLGFPIALVLAWTFDITPQGIRRDSELSEQDRSQSNRWRLLDFGIIAVLAVAVIYLLLDDDGHVPDPSADPASPSIAVLPMQLLNDDQGRGYLADGITMSLINELSKIESLRVISRTSVQKYRDSALSVPEIARELRVGNVIEGTVLSSGDQIRISANLVPANSDSPTWSKVFDRDLGNVLALQTEIARAVAAEVSISLTRADQRRLTAPKPVDPEVLELIYKGRYLLHTERGPEAIERIMQATRLAPDYAPAWTELGRAYYTSSDNNDPALLGQAKDALARALSLDDEDSDAHQLTGAIALYSDWDWQAALAGLNRSLELNPGNERAWQVLGDYYEALGDYARAEEFGKRSIEANPRSANMRMNLGLTYLYAGQADQAMRECTAALDLDPDSRWAMLCLAESHAQMGNVEQAIQYADSAVQNLQTSDVVLALAAQTYGAVGETQKAQVLRTHLEAASSQRYVADLVRAYAAYAVEDIDAFFAHLEQAVANRNTYTPWTATVPHFAAIRQDPRMQALIERMGLPSRDSPEAF